MKKILLIALMLIFVFVFAAGCVGQDIANEAGNVFKQNDPCNPTNAIRPLSCPATPTPTVNITENQK
jgi:hypothetical protein